MADSFDRSVASLPGQPGDRRGLRTPDHDDSWDRSLHADAGNDDRGDISSLRTRLVEQHRREVELRGTIALQQQEVEALKFRLDSAERALGSIHSSLAWAVATRVSRSRSRLMPAGSRRHRLWRMTSSLVRTCVKHGPRAAARKVVDKVARKAAEHRIRRRVARIQTLAHPSVPLPERPAKLRARTATVDVIVCVHNALDDVRRCLESVFQWSSPPFSVILVDDGSGPETAGYLAAFAGSRGCRLIRNDAARGYTFAANQGLRTSRADFVVLLNSDTIVTPQWIDRLVACAESDRRIGLVGPLSNTASWQSIPEISGPDGDWAANPLPEGMSVEHLAREVARLAGPFYPRLPILNGFCLLIRRRVLRQVGLFDEVSFGRGYGEENDYCLRAVAAGWHLAVAADTYVYHAQSRSYSKERRAVLCEQAGIALNKKHGVEMVVAAVEVMRSNPQLEEIRALCRDQLGR
jgi:GT2 family glycosyltransferase